MTRKRSVFYEAWRACLREHFVYVVRIQDTITEETLRHVLMDTGFGEQELEALRAEGLALRVADEANSTASG